MTTTSMPKTFEAQLADTQKAITLMMDIDSYPQTNRAVINSAFLGITQSKTYINQIRGNVQQIFADGKFTLADAPNVLLIIAQSQATLNLVITNSVNLQTSLKQDSMKYIIFGIFRFVLLIENVSTVELDATFSPLWTLIAFNPADVAVKAKAMFSCCSASPIKTSTVEPAQ